RQDTRRRARGRRARGLTPCGGPLVKGVGRRRLAGRRSPLESADSRDEVRSPERTPAADRGERRRGRTLDAFEDEPFVPGRGIVSAEVSLPRAKDRLVCDP